MNVHRITRLLGAGLATGAIAADRARGPRHSTRLPLEV